MYGFFGCDGRVFACAKMCSLAAYERARRALRGKCAPVSSRFALGKRAQSETASPKQKPTTRVGAAGYSSHTVLGRYPLPAPGKRACRSSDGVCAPVSSRFALGKRAQSEIASPKQKPTTRVGFVLEVTAGFEPADNGVADRGLTTWLRHHDLFCLTIIAEALGFVKPFFTFSL